MIHTPHDVARLVNERGFLPFFESEIPDFSLEEETPVELWFPDDKTMGVWDWKSDIILEADCAYGKFFRSKACFVSMEVFPHLVNYRRALHVLSADERGVLSVICENKSLLSGELKKLCGYESPRAKRESNPLVREYKREHVQSVRPSKPRKARPGFEALITHLQMSGHVLIAAFEYKVDRKGRNYGWGVARYCTPEDFFGAERLRVNCTPEESLKLLRRFLKSHYPAMTQSQIADVLEYR